MKSTSSMSDLFHNDTMPPHMHPNIQEQVQQQHQMHQMQAHNEVHKSPRNTSYFHHSKVEGALTYLSEVKTAFASQPQVYNQFLDVMKEFKAQRIDTTTVIHKVSTLFRERPNLVVGFNSFLPPGYIIKLSSNDNINVTFPNQVSSSFQLSRASSPIRRLQQDVPEEKSNEEIVATPELPVSSSDKSLNCTKEISEEADPQSSPKKPVSEDIPSCPLDISSDVHNAARALHCNQPVDFSQAVKYVNKIKGRFYGQPDVYKQFLKILHSYQQEQKKVKEGTCLRSEVLSEKEVYAKVANLFGKQSDLLDEFGQFLPESSSSTASPVKEENNICISPTETNHAAKAESHINNRPVSKSSISGKRHNHFSLDTPRKKSRTRNERNMSYSEAGKFGSLTEFQFFDKVRKALRNKDVYDSFLRCLILFNEEVVPKEELINLVKQFLGKFPELLKEFKNMLGLKDSGSCLETVPNKVACQARKRLSAELEMEIDYSSCRKCGASYRALPSTYAQPKCSGRTNLCKEVLNDTWVSFPSWSEDSTFVSSRKTQYEEFIYRCEDERFELDVVLETNLAAIRALEAVIKKITRMPQEEKTKFHLDDTLGGTSDVIHQRAIRRIYGDKSADIIEGLKKNPVVAVPLVLRRLKAKEEEWREAQKNYNKQWREQNEKFYLKSLDHQGITFRQTDVKQLRSKNLLNEIETIYEEHRERAEEGIDMPIGPHMTLCYKHRSIMDDASDLIIHHVKRQTGISKEDKHKIKVLLRHFIPDLFELSRGDVSDDETEKADVEENNNSPQAKTTDIKNSSSSNSISSKSSGSELCKRVNSRTNSNSSNASKKFDDNADNINKDNMDIEDDNVENNQELCTSSSNDHLKKTHNLFFVNNTWYLFFRLHNILCDRLCKIHHSATQLAKEEEKERKDKKQSAAAALQIDSKNKVCLEESYLTFISLAKSLLDGNTEIILFEDTLREMFGIHAYIVYTVDKVVQNIVRQLQAIVGDEICSKYLELYNEFTKSGLSYPSYNTTGSIYSTESAYQKKAEQIQSDENCFKLVAYIDECKLTVELLDTEAESPEDPVEYSKWAEYVDSYVTGKIHTPVTRHTRKYYRDAKVFLQRNIRKWECLAEEHTKEHTKYFSSDKEGVNHDDPFAIISSTLSNIQPVPPMECVRQKAMENMEVSDNTECKFNVNSYKMIFVVRSESYLYKRQSLRKACQTIRQQRLNKFQTWHKSWERRYLSGLKTSKSEKDSSIIKDIGYVP